MTANVSHRNKCSGTDYHLDIVHFIPMNGRGESASASSNVSQITDKVMSLLAFLMCAFNKYIENIAVLTSLGFMWFEMMLFFCGFSVA